MRHGGLAGQRRPQPRHHSPRPQADSHSPVRYWTPFGGFGGFGGSGAGREPGPDALRRFTETENVFIHSEE
ncbi:hypothetical protein AB0A71_12615 [Kitasatospora aureofaciens]|uniref:hypothetical protein n=1 Tax=Kitasatospora aureofaciens TaxID=1894 RepID=UPI0033FAC06A